jgi:fructokinase
MVASAVGNDKLGYEFCSFLSDRGIGPHTFKVDLVHPTGRVDVTIDELGQPTYNFEANVAWDYLEFSDSWELLASDCNAVSFGTRAQRSPKSQQTITRFLQVAQGAMRLFDANLRQKFYTIDVVRQSFELATAAKLNADELPMVCELLDVEAATHCSADAAIRVLMERFQLDWIALTRGYMGTALYAAGDRYEAPVPDCQPDANANSVGAGDACGAGLIVGALLGWPHQQRVALANNLGSFVASQPGAVPELPQYLLDSVNRSTAN